ncbi:hypothetical protein J2X43_003495 [Rhizobium sp. BE258]|nr:hypothetical protein [Rhizobium sp. BE258]
MWDDTAVIVTTESPSSDHNGGAKVPFSFLQQWPV